MSDHKSDIYEDFARRPGAVHLLVRTGFNRRLEGGTRLFDHADGLAEVGRFNLQIAAAPRRITCQATLALRFGPVSIMRPKCGMLIAALKPLPETVSLHLVDIREMSLPPTGVEQINGCS